MNKELNLAEIIKIGGGVSNIEIINMTPHDVNLLDLNNNKIHTYKSQGSVRLEQKDEIIGNIIDSDGLIIPITTTSFGQPNEIGDSKPNRLYIVSRMVLNELRGKRFDLITPNQIVKDDNNHIIGCRSFAID